MGKGGRMVLICKSRKFKIDFKKVLFSFIISIVLIFNNLSVFAYDDSKPHDIHDITTWCQGSFPESDTRRLAGGTGDTLTSSACSYFSMSYILAKGGYINPKKETPIDIIDKVESYNGWDTAWGHMNGSVVSKLEPDLQCDQYMLSLEGMGNKKALAVLKGLYDEGKYLQVCISANATAGHYIFIDEFIGQDDFKIGDSGFKGTKWSDYYKDNGGSFKYVNVYSSKSGRKCNEQESIYIGNVGSSGDKTNSGASDEEKGIYEELKSEWELSGMKYYKLSDVQNDVSMASTLYTVKDVNHLNDLKDGIDAKEDSTKNIIRVITNILGFILILYGILLIVAYLFDYFNNFVEFSLLLILSFGRLMVATEKGIEVSSKRVKYVSLGGLITRVAIIISVGILVMSNSVWNIIIGLISKIVSIFI